MRDATRVVLIDTNILAYLMIEGDRTTAAQKLFERDSEWCSEAFVMVEFSNILATYIRTKALTRTQGTRLLTEAQPLYRRYTTLQVRKRSRQRSNMKSPRTMLVLYH